MTHSEILKIAKPILFNTEMIRVIQDGRKTATRRVLKPHNPVKAKKCGYYQGSGLWYDNEFNICDKDTHIKDYTVSCCWIGTKIYIQKYAPYKVGNYLYVRETWSEDKHNYLYRADFSDADLKKLKNILRWGSPKSMPRNAARIFLRVTDVRVDRLQDITDEQIVAEGCNIPITASNEERCLLAFARFPKLWNSTIKKSDLDKYGWDANPWVWVIEFERVEVEQ